MMQFIFAGLKDHSVAQVLRSSQGKADYKPKGRETSAFRYFAELAFLHRYIFFEKKD